MIPSRATNARRHSSHRRRLTVSWALLPLSAMVLVGCATTPQPGGLPGDTEYDPTGATPTTGAFGTGDESDVGTSDLVLWTVPEFRAETEDGRGLGAELEAYQTANPNVSIVTVLKPSRGPTGIVAYLESTFRVVPEQMPDMATVPLESVTSAIAAGWLKAIPAAVSDDRIDGSFAFARDLSRRDDGRWAIPFAVDTVHAVANEDALPDTWDDVLTGTAFVVPEPGGDAAGLATPLTFYASAGGDIASLPAADQEAAADTLSFYGDGVASGYLAVADGGTTPRDSWNTFLNDELDSGTVSAGTFAPQQANFPGLEWGPLPGRDSTAPPVGWGWAIVFTSNEPGQAVEAGQLIDWLTHPEQRGWIASTGHLPAWIEGFVDATISGIDPAPGESYLEFVLSRLEGAVAADQSDYWGEDWASTVGQVLAGESAEASVSAISP